jgi:hypothetical protein
MRLRAPCSAARRRRRPRCRRPRRWRPRRGSRCRSPLHRPPRDGCSSARAAEALGAQAVQEALARPGGRGSGGSAAVERAAPAWTHAREQHGRARALRRRTRAPPTWRTPRPRRLRPPLSLPRSRSRSPRRFLSSRVSLIPARWLRMSRTRVQFLAGLGFFFFVSLAHVGFTVSDSPSTQPNGQG